VKATGTHGTLKSESQKKDPFKLKGQSSQGKKEPHKGNRLWRVFRPRLSGFWFLGRSNGGRKREKHKKKTGRSHLIGVIGNMQGLERPGKDIKKKQKREERGGDADLNEQR